MSVIGSGMCSGSHHHSMHLTWSLLHCTLGVLRAYCNTLSSPQSMLQDTLASTEHVARPAYQGHCPFAIMKQADHTASSPYDDGSNSKGVIPSRQPMLTPTAAPPVCTAAPQHVSTRDTAYRQSLPAELISPLAIRILRWAGDSLILWVHLSLRSCACSTATLTGQPDT